AGPRWGTDWTQAPAPGRDLVVVLDLSRSMLAEDVLPSRQERAKQALRELSFSLQRRGGGPPGPGGPPPPPPPGAPPRPPAAPRPRPFPRGPRRARRGPAAPGIAGDGRVAVGHADRGGPAVGRRGPRRTLPRVPGHPYAIGWRRPGARRRVAARGGGGTGQRHPGPHRRRGQPGRRQPYPARARRGPAPPARGRPHAAARAGAAGDRPADRRDLRARPPA